MPRLTLWANYRCPIATSWAGWLSRVTLGSGLLASSLTPLPVLAQPQGVVVPAQGRPGQPMPNGQPGQPGPNGAPGQPGSPPGGEKGPEGDKKEGASSAPKPISRPEKPAAAGDRAEFSIRPNADGKVQLNFHGQKWLDVLEWYAEISSLSLDWQEVPGDFINLRTQRSYSVPEIRDVLNRHLMDRGYTLLRSGEVLVVANLKKLDPALVPRVMPEDLANLDAHEFVKTSFKLEWLIAENTAEELKPLLSPNGKIWAMKATNRIEALDAVANLRAVYNVLKDEQSGNGQERLVREFRLQHSRAEEVYDLLLGLLGKEKPKKDDGPMDPRRMMQMQQQMQQMQQMQGQQGNAAAAKKPGEIHLVVNRRDNSILVNGPPDQVAVVEQAVRQLDVPPDIGQSLLQNPNRMQVYRLAAVDPEPLVETLKEVGNLDPQTQLRVDKKNKSIIAYASLADHVTIRAMIERLDGTDRRFEVIRLRKLEADYVAGSIQFMMGEAEDKSQSNRRSYSFYDPFSAGSGGSSEDSQARKFRVDADVEHNRLLIWANDIELAEIQNLLVKLGELPPPGSRSRTMRTVDSIPAEDTQYLLERLREAWPQEGTNPLQLKMQPGAKTIPPLEKEPAANPVRSEPTTQRSPEAPIPAQPALFRFSKSSISHTREALALLGTVPADGEAAPTTLNDLQVAERPAVAPEAETSTADPLKEESRNETALPKAKSRESDLEIDGQEIDARALVGKPLPQRTRSQERLGHEEDDARDSLRGSQETAAQRGAAPVIIELDEEGRWILRSEDTAALDRMEDLLADLAPPRRDYKMFQLKHSTSWAYGIALTLEDFFKETKPKEQRRPYWYYDDSSSQKKEDPRRLSKRRELKFIADSDSNTILVVGADTHQMRIIEELIEYYDQPVASDAKALRRTEIFPIKHSRAQVIAEAIKDVYRDLLSENDKALQQGQGQNQNQQRQSEKTVTYVYDSFDSDKDDKKGGGTPPAPVRFKGALSIGIDEISNSLIISSTENLLASIRAMVNELDVAAQPKTPRLQVIQIDRNVNVDVVQQKLAKLLKERQQQRQPQQPQPGRPNNQPQQAMQVESDDNFP